MRVDLCLPEMTEGKPCESYIAMFVIAKAVFYTIVNNSRSPDVC